MVAHRFSSLTKPSEQIALGCRLMVKARVAQGESPRSLEEHLSLYMFYNGVLDFEAAKHWAKEFVREGMETDAAE